MFGAIFPTAKRKFFQQRMINFFNILELNDHKHQTNVTLIDENLRSWYYLPRSAFIYLEHTVNQCLICQTGSYKKILMASVSQNFNFLTFETQLILYMYF